MTRGRPDPPATDPTTMAEVYRAHVGDVLRVLRRGFAYRVGTETRVARIESAFDAEEICQEAFAAFFAHVRDGRFDPSRPVRPYLVRIAVNLALKRLGRGGREVPMVEPPEPAVPARAPEDAERARLLAEFQAALPPLERDVFVGWFDDDVSQAAVGESLGLSRDQVGRAIARIRASALRFFGARGWFDDLR
jgi:RNA polymerase sigma factor (sigma-70 family)